MVIGEAVTDEITNELVAKMQEHVGNVPGLLDHSILVEEGGRMVILATNWQNRQACLTYHTSRIYRQFVASTQHMLIGDCVVKLFQNKTEPT
jgi:quinol monooxygenase YgiN